MKLSFNLKEKAGSLEVDAERLIDKKIETYRTKPQKKTRYQIRQETKLKKAELKRKRDMQILLGMVIFLAVMFVVIFIGAALDNSSSESTPGGLSGEVETNESPAQDVLVDELLSERYAIGEEVVLGEVAFNIYKIDDEKNELYLLAQNSIATIPFSNDEHEGLHPNSYEGSLVEHYIAGFVLELESNNVAIKSSGIIDMEDLYSLGFKHSDTLSGLPYRVDSVPEFVEHEKTYWLGGYSKYSTRSWAYTYGTLDTESCNDSFGVRPVIVIEPSEIEQ